MFVVGQYREKKTNDFMDALKLLLFYGAAGLLYMLLSSWLMHLYGYTMDQATQNRATFIHTPEQIIFKINWLFQTVIPQAVLKSTAIFLRLFGFKTNCLFYEIHLKSTMLENLVMTISGGMILIYYIKLLYKHRFFKFFIDLIAIILSFYPFLILPESYTLSYYMIPIVTLFLYFELSGLEILANLCNSRFKKLANYEKNFGTCVFALLLSVCIFSGNAYTNWWVEYNRDSYMFIKQSLSQELNEKTKSICVLGSISPYVGGNPYVVFSTQQALTSLGYDLNNYEFFQMDNEYYISTMSSVEMEQVKKRVTADKFERFRAYFLHDEMYNRWLYTYSADEDGLHFMQEVLIQSGLGRFKETTENVVISLSGFNAEHDF